MPVRARSSVVLPWSMWPAVPTTTLTRRGPRSSVPHRVATAGEASGQQARRPPARRSAGRTRARRPRCARAPGPDRAAGAAAARSGEATRTATPADGSTWPGSEPPPTALSSSTTSACGTRRPRRSADARAAQLVGRPRDRPPDRDVRARARPARYSPSVAATPARIALSGRIARASGSRRSRAIRSARPTISPACGPPTSLSPLNTTTSAPAASRSAGVGSWASPKAAVSSSAPEPRSSMTSAPCRCASGGDLGQVRRLREAGDREVRRVDAQHELRAALGQRRLEVRRRASGSSCPPRPGGRRRGRSSPGSARRRRSPRARRATPRPPRGGPRGRPRAAAPPRRWSPRARPRHR